MSKLDEAKYQDELRTVLGQTAYSYLKDGESVATTLEKITDLNNNADTPLDALELEEIIKDKSKHKGKSKDDDAKQASFLETSEFIAEQILATDATHATDANGDTMFLKYDKKTGEVTEEDTIIINNIIYKPITDNLTATGTVWLPSGIEEYETTEKLVEEIKNFVFGYFEVGSFYEGFLPYLVLFYWVYDKFPFIPYIHFVGLTGTGKTTAQEVLGSICYKPIDASGSLTLSPIFRTASKWGGTLLLDEFEPEGEGFKEMLLFLKSTVSDKVILKTEGDSRREVIAYMAKCPKIFTSENPINNAGLQSRTIVVKMEKNKKRLPLYRLGKFHTQARHIRNKLLLWRFRHYDKINLDDIEYGFPELEAFDRRVQQVMTPIYYFSDDSIKVKIVEFAKIQQEETQKERRDSIEGQIFQYIMDHYPDNVAIKEITEELNKDKSARLVGEKKVANLIRKIFNFKIERTGHDNVRMVNVTGADARLDELSDYFGIEKEVLPQEQVAQVAQVATEQIGLTDAPKVATDLESEYFPSVAEGEVIED